MQPLEPKSSPVEEINPVENISESQESIESTSHASRSIPHDEETAYDLPHLLAELESLKASQRELEAKQYVDASMARFSDLLRWRVGHTIEQWAEQLIVEVVPHVNGFQSALYLMEEESKEPYLRLIGSYAAPEGTIRRIPVGEGLTGQAARTGREILLSENQAFRTHAASSLAQIEIKTLIIIPLLHQEVVEGVLEIGFAKPPEEAELIFLRRFSIILAASLGAVRNQTRIQRLYEEAQEKSELLAAQEEEMRQSVEELQATQDEMRRVQMMISEQKAFLDSSLNSTDIMFIATDRTGLIKYWNQAAERQLGYDAAEITDKLTLAAYHDEQEFIAEAARLSQEYNTTVQPGIDAFSFVPYQGKSYIREWTYIAKDGRRFPVELTVSAWKDAKGAYAGLLGIAQDISARKVAEQTLAEQHSELASREEELRQNLEELEATQEQMRQMQAEVVEKEKLLSQVANNVPGMVYQFRLNPATNEMGFTYVSDKSLTLLGKTPQQLLDDMYALEIHPEDLQNAIEAIGPSAKDLTPYQYETRLKTQRGDEWFRFEATPFLQADNSVLWYGYMQNIHSQVSLRNEIAQQRDIVNALMEGSNDSTYVVDMNLKLITFNERMRQGLGLYSQKEVISGSYLMDYFPPELSEDQLNLHRAILVGEAMTHYAEYPDPGKNFALSYLQLDYFPVRNTNGTIFGAACVTRDITELTTKEREAASQRDLIRAFINSTEDSIIALDLEYKVILMNERMRLTLGQYSQQEVELGQSIFNYVPAEQRDHYRALYKRTIAGEIVRDIATYPMPNGKEASILVEYSPLRNTAGEINGIACVSRDISDLVGTKAKRK